MRFCAVVSPTGRRRAKLRRSPLTENCRDGKRDVAAVAGLAFPHREAEELQSFEWSREEVQFGIRELAWRVALVVRYDLDGHGVAPS